MFPFETAQALIRAAERAGLPGAPLERALGPPTPVVEDAAFDRLWSAAARAWPTDDLELTIAAHLQPGSFAPFDFSVITAPTVGDALVVLSRALSGIVGVGTTLTLEPAPRGSTSVRLLNATDENVVVVDALLLATVLCRLRQQTTTPLDPERVWLTRPAPRHRAPWTAFFGAPVRFGARDSGLVLSAAAWRTRLVSSNEAAHRALAPLLPSAGGGFVDEVKAHLRHRLTERQSLEQVARRLGLSARTLQRRLAASRVTLRALVTETRVDEARRLVGQGRTRDEVAALVGFSSASALSRAMARPSRRGR
ncbi:MAG: AraC family transcriptional regulator ligand-binding domain-containing protein [Myxococcaceae bacterium]|jgi:AraC-like DNA-binding protein|nr:AraC family transcriptional regulator ligand-binding domain-containing protein [Myxococcaceae bacterium]MCA3010847.1 AraC family transcriptional regulator ligand-binding domain-containing protein [Myxococcaceae bacterium]